MKLSNTLTGYRSLYIETAPLIYFTESRPGYVEKMSYLLEYVSANHIRINTSVITIPETLKKPLLANDTQLVERYRDLFYRTRGIVLLPIVAQIAERAASLRAKYNLRTPDALHVAAAIDSGCVAFLTNDIGIKRVEEITILLLDELEIEPSQDE